MSAQDPSILLHANVPKPLHGLNPRTLLGRKWWDVTRRSAYARQDNTCRACGIHKDQARFRKHLEAHESYEIDYQSGRSEMIEVNALCHACHQFIHSGRLVAQLAAGQISAGKFLDVLSHGFKVLASANLAPAVHTLRAAYAGKLLLQQQNAFIPAWLAGLQNPGKPDTTGAPWWGWHLVLNGQTYPPLYETWFHWFRHYNPDYTGPVYPMTVNDLPGFYLIKGPIPNQFDDLAFKIYQERKIL